MGHRPWSLSAHSTGQEWLTSREETISVGLRRVNNRTGGQRGRPVDHATRGGTVTGRPRTPPARVCQSC